MNSTASALVLSLVVAGSPDTAHEWQTWRRSLREFAPLLFRN